ncbi:MAG TPA: protein kinase [Polyangiaceae bacterium]
MDGMVNIGDVIDGKYRVDAILGRGAMGLVVAAWHLELEEPVAVKLLLAKNVNWEEVSERFRQEARAAAKVKSEHVARVFDVGTTSTGFLYMVMEYLEGHTLTRELEQNGPPAIALAVQYVMQAGEAVAQAHAVGLVHRDLKPENLFLARQLDGSAIIKVLDFGISKARAGSFMKEMSLTGTSWMMGSPLYMSPEQMRSARDVDEGTDIWALGAILYELIAGRPPFVADCLPDLCQTVLYERPPLLTPLRNGVSEALEEIVFRCLRKKREERWPSVAALTEALAQHAPDEARVHATRATRILTATNLGRSRIEYPPKSAPGIGAPLATTASPPAAQEPEPGSLQPVATWTATNRASRNVTRPILVAALSVGLLLLVVGTWSLAVSRGISEPVSSAERPASPPKAAARGEVTAEDARPKRAAPEEPKPAAESEPVERAVPESTASVRRIPARASLPRSTRAPVTRRAATVPSRSDVVAPARQVPGAGVPENDGTVAEGSSGISDFGGRR